MRLCWLQYVNASLHSCQFSWTCIDTAFHTKPANNIHIFVVYVAFSNVFQCRAGRSARVGWVTR